MKQEPTLASRISTSILGFLYPNICIACGETTVEAGMVCSACYEHFDRFSTPDKARLALDWRLQRHENAASIDDAVGLFYFNSKNLMQNILYALKYEGVYSLGIMLGKELGMFLKNDRILKHVDVVIPTPIHHLKKLDRGFNQSEMIVNGFCQTTNMTERRWMKRIIHSQSQTKLGSKHDERKQNIKNVFQAEPSVSGKTILLVDDVFTTGATLLSAADELKAKGAKRVFVASATVRTDY